MGSVPTEIRTGTGACPYDGWGGHAKDIADGNDKAAVGRWVVIRAIRVIRLIRDSDTVGRWMDTHGWLGGEVGHARVAGWMSRARMEPMDRVAD